MSSSIKSKMRTERIANAIALVFVILFAMLVLFPLWWIFRSSLMTNPEIGSLNFFPGRWIFANYAEALEVFTFFSYFGCISGDAASSSACASRHFCCRPWLP